MAVFDVHTNRPMYSKQEFQEFKKWLNWWKAEISKGVAPLDDLLKLALSRAGCRSHRMCPPLQQSDVRLVIAVILREETVRL